MSDDPEGTGEEREKVGPGRPPKEHQFKPGNSGRPKGSRNKLSEAFVADLYDAWQEKGQDVISRVAAERPQDFLKVVASLLPKQVEIKEDAFGELTDEQLAALITAARHSLGVSGEGGSGAEDPEEPEPSEGLSAVH